MASKLRLAVCAVALGALYFGLAASAMAHNEPLWVRQFGTNHDDGGIGVATDAAGNVYITGTTAGSLGGPNRGHSDAWVAKYDAAGRVLWVRQLGTARSDEGRGVATDAAGNVFLTGYMGLNFINRDAWVVKVNAAGRPLWRQQLGTEGDDPAFGATTDAGGNVYISGYTTGSLGSPNRGSDDGWVAKYDAGGGKVWVRQFGTETSDEFSEGATDAAGNIYLTGWTFSSIGGTSAGGFDAWVVKYSTRP